MCIVQCLFRANTCKFGFAKEDNYKTSCRWEKTFLQLLQKVEIYFVESRTRLSRNDFGHCFTVQQFVKYVLERCCETNCTKNCTVYNCDWRWAITRYAHRLILFAPRRTHISSKTHPWTLYQQFSINYSNQSIAL